MRQFQINLDHLSMCVYTLTSGTHDPPQLGIESTVQLTIDQLGPAFRVASLWVYTSKQALMPGFSDKRKEKQQIQSGLCVLWHPLGLTTISTWQWTCRTASVFADVYNCPVLETNVNQYERLNKRRHDRWDATVCSSAPSQGPGGIFFA